MQSPRRVSSRYNSPSPPTTVHVPRRSQSPSLTRTVSEPSQLVQKRFQSVERKRPSTPPSPARPSTPVDGQLSSRRTTNGRSLESLWPSTMRSLSVSFQSDIISIPVTKKEKPVNNAFSDRTLRPSCNVAYRKVEVSGVGRKPTPERKRSPLNGKNGADQVENSKPIDSSRSRLIDHHIWPSRLDRNVISNCLSRSVDFTDKMGRTSTTIPRTGVSSLRRMSSDGICKPLQKSVSDTMRLLSHDDNSVLVSGTRNRVSARCSDKIISSMPTVKLPSLPTQILPLSSPSKNSVLSPSVTRGVSPSRTRPSTPCRGVSPSRTRPSTPCRGVSPSRPRVSSTCDQPCSSTSVLSFIANFKRGKKGTNYIDDAHQLRLLHNRYLQLRFVNARTEAVTYIQKVNAERILYNVWNNSLALWDSVTGKRMNLQQSRLELKLSSILSSQMAHLDNWASLERDHSSSLFGAAEDLKASTLRLPLTGGAMADIENLNAAIFSAVDVMQAMSNSMCSLPAKVEGVNSMVLELAIVAAQERVMLNECEALLSLTAAMQVEEYSSRIHLLQMKQTLELMRSC